MLSDVKVVAQLYVIQCYTMLCYVM